MGVDVDNDDDLPLMGDIDSGDHDSNDMSRPRKIRRWDEGWNLNLGFINNCLVPAGHEQLSPHTNCIN